MKLDNPMFYNEASSTKLGWTPEWFGCEDFTEALTRAVKAFQIKNDLDDDGLVGPMTFRRIFTEREAHIKHFETSLDRANKVLEKPQKYILCGYAAVPIEWDKVVGLNDPENLKLTGGFKVPSGQRNVNKVVVHWDACLSSKSMKEILERRGLSVQFGIDNDGTIYQLVNAEHLCWHARGANYDSVGIEVSNAVNLKYQGHYVREGFPKRPVIKDARCHGRTLNPFLGFYPVQLRALEALVKALCSHYKIPLITPQSTTKLPQEKLKDYRGVLAHYHINSKKIDPAGLDITALCRDNKK